MALYTRHFMKVFSSVGSEAEKNEHNQTPWPSSKSVVFFFFYVGQLYQTF